MKPVHLFSFVFILVTGMLSLHAGNPVNNRSQGLKTNLSDLSYDTGSWTINKNGLNSNLTGKGDGFVFSNTTARNFVFEVDIKFNNRNESAASLVFGSNNDLDRKNMYVANIHAHNGVARVFKFQHNSRNTEALDLVGQKTVPLTADNQYHLSVTVIGKHIVFSINGEIVSNTADYVSGNIYGQNTAFTGNHLGLLSWNADCIYQNLYVTELDDTTNPLLSNLNLQAPNGNVEHNIQFDPAQYVYIAYVSNETEEVNVQYDKVSAETSVNAKMGVTDFLGNTLPLQVGTNTATLICKNRQATLLYQLVIIRRNSSGSYYNEFDRGQYHFSVKQGWANDPNGMVYYKGEYHLFHQFYYGINWGPMHWGHSVSRDLIHWEELPIAFYPDEYGTMFSGSAVIDDNNTSGLFTEKDGSKSATGGLVAIITADGNGERVILAHSKDGRNWKKHEGVVLDWTDDPLFDSAFRDPKVFRYQNKWFMVIAGGPLRIYSSDNLINWQAESNDSNLHTECPDMFLLPVVDGEPDEKKWVLSRGGRFYKVGDFKQVAGKWQFIPENQYTGGGTNNDGIMNFGNDAYAAQTYYMGSFDSPQRVIEINWMNFRVPNLGIDNGNLRFNGNFTLQNELSLIKNNNGKYLLQQTPVAEYQSLRNSENKISLRELVLYNENKTLDFTGDSYEITAEFTLNGSTEVGFNIRVGNGYFTKISYNAVSNVFIIDRRKTGTGPSYYLQKFEQVSPLPIVDGKVKLHIFVDRNTVELFGADYTVTGAALIYPPGNSKGLEIFSSNGNAVANVDIYPLVSIHNK